MFFVGGAEERQIRLVLHAFGFEERRPNLKNIKGNIAAMQGPFTRKRIRQVFVRETRTCHDDHLPEAEIPQRKVRHEHSVICIEGILLGDTTILLIKTYEAEVSEKKEPEKRPKTRLLSKTSVAKVVPEKVDDLRVESD